MSYKSLTTAANCRRMINADFRHGEISCCMKFDVKLKKRLCKTTFRIGITEIGWVHALHDGILYDSVTRVHALRARWGWLFSKLTSVICQPNGLYPKCSNSTFFANTVMRFVDTLMHCNLALLIVWQRLLESQAAKAGLRSEILRAREKNRPTMSSFVGIGRANRFESRKYLSKIKC